MYRFDDEPNFKSFAAAVKAGNPDAIVAFNPGLRLPVVCHTKHEDYTAGEVNLPDLPKVIATCPGRWIERDGHKAQYHILTFLGSSWCAGKKPALSDERIIGHARRLTARGGVITFDVPIRKSGRIPRPFIAQLRALESGISSKP